MRNNRGTTPSPAGQSLLVGGRWESSCFPFFLYPAGYQQEGVAYSGVRLWVCVRVGGAQDVCFNDITETQRNMEPSLAEQEDFTSDTEADLKPVVVDQGLGRCPARVWYWPSPRKSVWGFLTHTYQPEILKVTGKYILNEVSSNTSYRKAG